MEIPTLDLNIPSSSGADRTWMSPVEDVFGYLHMNSPLARLGGVTIIVGGLLYFLQPAGYFSYDGNGRPWAVWSNDPDAIFFPWWLTAIMAGLVCAVFV